MTWLTDFDEVNGNREVPDLQCGCFSDQINHSCAQHRGQPIGTVQGDPTRTTLIAFDGHVYIDGKYGYGADQRVCRDDEDGTCNGTEDGMARACELCGELIDWSSPLPSKSEAGEFYDPSIDKGDSPMQGHVIAHAQCGIDAGLDMA
jgi:hypothetical protein